MEEDTTGKNGRPERKKPCQAPARKVLLTWKKKTTYRAEKMIKKKRRTKTIKTKREKRIIQTKRKTWRMRKSKGFRAEVFVVFLVFLQGVETIREQMGAIFNVEHDIVLLLCILSQITASWFLNDFVPFQTRRDRIQMYSRRTGSQFSRYYSPAFPTPGRNCNTVIQYVWGCLLEVLLHPSVPMVGIAVDCQHVYT